MIYDMTEISLITSSTVDKDCIFLPSCCCLSPGATGPIMSDHHVAHGNVDVRLGHRGAVFWGLGMCSQFSPAKHQSFFKLMCVLEKDMQLRLIWCSFLWKINVLEKKQMDGHGWASYDRAWPEFQENTSESQKAPRRKLRCTFWKLWVYYISHL